MGKCGCSHRATPSFRHPGRLRSSCRRRCGSARGEPRLRGGHHNHGRLCCEIKGVHCVAVLAALSPSTTAAATTACARSGCGVFVRGGIVRILKTTPASSYATSSLSTSGGGGRGGNGVRNGRNLNETSPLNGRTSGGVGGGGSGTSNGRNPSASLLCRVYEKRRRLWQPWPRLGVWTAGNAMIQPARFEHKRRR